MKNLMTLLVCTVMVLVSALGAKAQFNDAAISRMVTTANNQINDRMDISGESHISEADLAPLKGSLAARKRFLDSYTSTEVLGGKFSFHRPNGVLVERDTTMNARMLNVRKLKGDAKYNGIVAVLYGFDPSFADPAPYVVMDYGLVPVAKTQTTPQGAGQGEQQAQGSQQSSFVIDKIMTGEDGKQYVVGRDQNGKPVIYPLETFLAVESGPKKEDVGDSGVGATRTATVTNSTTVSQQGDPDLVQQIQSGKTGNGNVPVQGEDEIFTISPRPGDIVFNKQANGQTKVVATGDPVAANLTEKHITQMIRHNYDLVELEPTDVTARVVEARNRPNIVVAQGVGGQMMPCPGPGFFLRGNNWVCGSGGFGVTNVYPMQFGGVPAHVNPGAGFSHPMNPRNYPAN